MEEEEVKGLRFVLKHYSSGMFDTRKAIRRFRATHPAKRRIRLRHMPGIAAAVLVCLAVVYHLIRGQASPVCLYSYSATTTCTLPDSSVATLYPHSMLRYQPDRFNKHRREVYMRGRIRFDVRRNRRIPFAVSGEYAKIEVLGTRFEVNENSRSSMTEVHVISGKVLFSSKDGRNGVVLTRHMQAVLPFGSDVPLVRDRKSTKGRSGDSVRFVYENTPLPEVLEELSGHFHVELSCASTGKSLTAEFETDSLDEIVSMIEESLDVKIRRRGAK